MSEFRIITLDGSIKTGIQAIRHKIEQALIYGPFLGKDYPDLRNYLFELESSELFAEITMDVRKVMAMHLPELEVQDIVVDKQNNSSIHIAIRVMYDGKKYDTVFLIASTDTGANSVRSTTVE